MHKEFDTHFASMSMMGTTRQDIVNETLSNGACWRFLLSNTTNIVLLD